MTTVSSINSRYSEILASTEMPQLSAINSPGDLWPVMRHEAELKAKAEPILGSYFHATILNHKNFGDALSFRLASKFDNPMLPTMLIRDVIAEAIHADENLLSAAEIDVLATYPAFLIEIGSAQYAIDSELAARILVSAAGTQT